MKSLREKAVNVLLKVRSEDAITAVDIVTKALENVYSEAIEDAAHLFIPGHNGHKQEFHTDNDSVAFTYRVMAIIEQNIRQLATSASEQNEETT